jgi:xylulokinase
MTQHALGFDVGLSGVRATVVRDDGALVAAARRPYRRARMADGIAEHDPEEWLEGVAETGREALAVASGAPTGASVTTASIAAIGVAALGPAPVLVDAELRPLTKALLFALDRRSEPQRLEMAARGPSERAAETLDNALPKLAWWLEHDPGAAARAAWALDATGFVVATLTGGPVMDSVTAADYALPAVEPPVPLPEPVEPTAVAGELRAGWAERLGLAPGIPVTAGTYDSFVDLAAAGVRRPGDSGLVLGTTTILCRAVDEDIEPPPGLGLSAYPGHGVLAGGWTLSGGLVLDWFADRFGAGDPVVRAAAEVEPGGLLALPYLAGERTPLWDPSARGALIGLTRDTGAPEVYRALVDSLALTALDHAERLESRLGPCPAWRATGGGTRHALWPQATADALGAPLEITPDAGEAVGPALLALRAVGADPERRPAAVMEPEPSRTERYRELLPTFRELSKAVAPALRAPQRPQKGSDPLSAHDSRGLTPPPGGRLR